jgi:hypothetical protein
VPTINRISLTTYFYRKNFRPSILIWANFDTAATRPSVGIAMRDFELIDLIYAQLGGMDEFVSRLNTFAKESGGSSCRAFVNKKARPEFRPCLCVNINRARLFLQLPADHAN